MQSLVEQAIKTLTTICNTSALHSSDEDTVKSYLKALHKNGEDINPGIIGNLALTYNWQPNPIKQIVKWSKAISTGGRVVIKNKQFVKSDQEIINHLKTKMLERNKQKS